MDRGLAQLLCHTKKEMELSSFLEKIHTPCILEEKKRSFKYGTCIIQLIN